MRIEVTQDHIKKGIAHSTKWCPLALALRDARCHNPDVNYIGARFTIGLDGHNVYCNFTTAVTRWIFDFEKSGKAEPISLNLNIKDHSLRIA